MAVTLTDVANELHAVVEGLRAQSEVTSDAGLPPVSPRGGPAGGGRPAPSIDERTLVGAGA